MRQKVLTQGLSLSITPMLYKKLRRAAKRARVTLSQIVRDLLEPAVILHEATYVEPEREEYIIYLTDRNVLRLRYLGYSIQALETDREAVIF